MNQKLRVQEGECEASDQTLAQQDELTVDVIMFLDLHPSSHRQQHLTQI